MMAVPASAAAPVVSGNWLTLGGKAIVQIAPCGQALCGRIVKILKPDPGKPLTDANNPDAALRSRPILGISILTGFTPGSDRWKGQIYDPQSGRTYRSELARDGTTLKVKGCFGPFCRTQQWSKVN